MKRVLTFILVLSMVLGSVGMIFAAPALEDVVGTKYEDAVARLASLSILEGYPDGTFRPDADITRAEFAAAVVRAKGLESAADAAKGAATGFTDVPGSHWASGYVGTAAKLGIVNGVGNDLFAPEALVKYEEAVTMVMRALGYEPAAQDKGGYPFGYLIVAAENGLLDKVKGTQGVAAPRGLVAQLLDNSLEIPLMVRVAYGDRIEYVVSGTRDSVKEKTLLDDMDFVSIEGEVIDIARTSSLKKNQIRIRIKEDDKIVGTKVYKVIGEIDYEAVFGTEVKAWLNDDDEVVFVKIESDVLFDAVKMDGKKLKLIDADDKYELAKDVKIYVDGEQVDKLNIECNYAKIVLNDEGDVAFLDAYNLINLLIVEEVDGNVVVGYGDNEVNAKDYTIVKDGRTIDISDLEDEDIFFYTTAKDGYAEVFNNSVEDEISRVYIDRITVAGEDYKYINVYGNVQYLDGSKLKDFNDDVAKDMKDVGEIIVFLDRKGDAVFVSGDLGEYAKTTFMAYLGKVSNEFNDRGTKKHNVDIINEKGAFVKYDVSQSKLAGWLNVGVNEANIQAVMPLGSVLEIEVDADNEITNVKVFPVIPVGNGTDVYFKNTAKYIDKYKVKSDAVVFLADDGYDVTLPYDKDDNKLKATTFDDADFEKVYQANIYKNAKDEIVAMVVLKTDKATETTAYTAVAVKGAAEVSGEKVWKLRLSINGVTKDYYTKKTSVGIANASSVVEGDFLGVKINDKSGDIDEITPKIANYSGKIIDSIKLGEKTFKLVGESDSIYVSTDAYVLDGEDKFKNIGLASLEKGDKVNVLLIDGGSYAKYVVRTDEVEGQSEDPGLSGKVTYINGGLFEVELPSDAKATDNFIVKVGNNTAVVTDGEAEFAAGITPGNIYTAELYNLNDLDTVLASVNFIAKATPAYAVTFANPTEENGGTLAATVDGVAISTGDTVEERKDVVFTVTLTNAAADRVKEWTVDGGVVDGEIGTTFTLKNLDAAVTVAVVLEAIPAEELAADGFKTTFATELALTLATVKDGDNIAAATTAYSSLSDEAKALLTAEIALLNDLEARENAINAVNTAGTAAALKTAIEDADLGLNLTTYNELIGAQKTIVIDALYGAGGPFSYTNTASVQAALDVQL